MPSLLDLYNPSILAIPAFHLLAVFPHGYALYVATQGKPENWDNRNPRSPEMKNGIKKRLDADTYAKYERLESCHANAMENLPLFATAVILGNMAGLRKEGLGGMTGFAASFLAVRLAYMAVYITHR
jgi:uncharacterized MAPEG superfamily protein